MFSELMKDYKIVDPTKMRANNFLKVQNNIEQQKISSINKGSGWKRISRCPLCGNIKNKLEFSKHSVEYVCCLNCNVRYAIQIPANLDDVYTSTGYQVYSIEDSDDNYNYRRERFGRERVSILETYCGNITNMHILDVGCGNGYFLSVAMEKSKYCFGTEFSEKLREFTIKKTSLTVYGKQLDELEPNSFDIITLFDVIEHIPNPILFFESLDRILRPNGSILIFTPNFDSFSIRVMKEYSSIVDPTEHIVLFTFKSLTYLANHFNYSVIYQETQGMDIINILSMMQYKKRRKNDFLILWNNELQAMINNSLCGDYGRIMYRKK